MISNCKVYFNSHGYTTHENTFTAKISRSMIIPYGRKIWQENKYGDWNRQIKIRHYYSIFTRNAQWCNARSSALGPAWFPSTRVVHIYLNASTLLVIFLVNLQTSGIVQVVSFPDCIFRACWKGLAQRKVVWACDYLFNTSSERTYNDVIQCGAP